METYQVFKQYGVPYPELKIRYMTSCWGSCRPKSGIITLNSKLIEAPRCSIEYVVLHEFAHFIHPNHSRKFYDFVSMLMPDWKERKGELERRV
jgi:predicted metal-dependent hydrolase